MQNFVINVTKRIAPHSNRDIQNKILRRISLYVFAAILLYLVLNVLG